MDSLFADVVFYGVRSRYDGGSSSVGLEHRIVAPKVGGSSLLSHPEKPKATSSFRFFCFLRERLEPRRLFDRLNRVVAHGRDDRVDRLIRLVDGRNGTGFVAAPV